MTLVRLVALMNEATKEELDPIVNKEVIFDPNDIEEGDPLHALHFLHNGMVQDLPQTDLVREYSHLREKKFGYHHWAMFPYRKRRISQYLDLSDKGTCLRQMMSSHEGFRCKGCGSYVCEYDYDHRNHYMSCDGFKYYISEDRAYEGRGCYL